MECQSTTKNLKINKDKSIGQVIVVVEGSSEEFRLMKHIFHNLFDYEYVPIKRTKGITDKLVSKKNSNNTIIVVNTCNSNIKSTYEDDNYRKELFELIRNDYKRNINNIPIYILWDRDKSSNDHDDVLKALKSFKNSMDNDEEMNGILLLSYPCVESYEMSNFNKQVYKKIFCTSQEAKSEMKKNGYSLVNISENSLLNAAGNMHRSFLKHDIANYDPSDFYRINKKIFDEQEELFKNNGFYKALSLITIMLVDLGIIYEE